MFRVGLHLGDMIVDGDDLYGDGVNVAARLEGEAAPGGIVVSGALHEAAAGKLQAQFVDLGRLSLKNIDRQVQAYRVEWNQARPQPSTPAHSPVAVTAPLSLPDKPSIAVLPFQNMGGDQGQDYFADGITEDIITALSHIPSLFVIARNSSFVYKGKAIDIRRIGRELGVRYVLEGSVRKAGQRLRITGQLVEVETGSHLWADRFDSVLEDVFDLQDRVTMAVAGAIEPSVTQAEIRRANRKPTENLQAYDWLLRGIGEEQLYSRDSVGRAIDMARRAIDLDPRYAEAYARLADWIMLRRVLGWMEDEAAETAEAVRCAHLAVQLAPNDSIVLTVAALALCHLESRCGECHSLARPGDCLESQFCACLWPGRAGTAFGGRLRDCCRSRRSGYASESVRLVFFRFQPGARRSPFVPASPARSGDMAEQGGPAKPAQRRNVSVSRQCTGTRRAHQGSPAAIQRLLEMQPMSTVSWHRQRRPRSQARARVRVGGRAAGGPARMTEQRPSPRSWWRMSWATRSSSAARGGHAGAAPGSATDVIEPQLAKHAAAVQVGG
jgi:TolB-like protein